MEQKIVTVRDARTEKLDQDGVHPKPKPKKPFRRKDEVIITGIADDLIGRFAIVTRCKGKMQRTGDTKQRIFLVELKVDGVEETIMRRAEEVRRRYSITTDDIRELIQRHVAHGAKVHATSYEHRISRLEESITKLMDDEALQKSIDFETPPTPVEERHDDSGTYLGFGSGTPERHSTHPYINIHAYSGVYDNRLNISFSCFVSTPTQLLAYAKQLEAAALRAIELRTSMLVELKEKLAKEKEKLANVENYTKQMADQFNEI